MMATYCIDADDFSEENDGWELLLHIKARVPKFRITLFTVPAECSREFLRTVERLGWIEMAAHGWAHPHPRECQDWTFSQSLAYLEKIEAEYPSIVRGFKAPGWQISDGMYRALMVRGWWVADQIYNDARRPEGLRCYRLDRPERLHHHVQDVCGNGLKESMARLIETVRDAEGFSFVSECVA